MYNRLAKEGKIDLIGKHSFYWLGVPLKTKDRTIGVLAVQSYTKDIIYRDENKNILTFVSTQIAMAIERKKAEKALRESREKFQGLFMNNPEASVYINPDGKILNVNPRFCELFGYSVDELKGKYINDMIVQKKRMKEAELLDKKSVTGYVSHDTFRQKKNGSLVPVSISAAPITIEGDLIGVMFLYKDITQQKQAEELLQKTKEELETRVEERTSKLSKAIDQLMEEFTERKKAEKEKERMHTQLLQVQKMEAIGTLAGGVAHDFNNLLTAIQGYTDLMLMKVEEKNPLHKYLKNIHRASIRAAGLTRQLLLFSRKQPMKLSLININQTVNGLVNMLSRVITETIDIKTKQDSNIWNIKADVANIEQVIMNLALNARDAMPKGGKLMIKTENVKINKKQSKNIPESRVGKFVCLSVSDTGLGIDKDIIDHIFVPFFSTKESGKGTGLGLSVAYGIIKQHDGWINVYSKSGKGSTFKVYLPAFPDETLKKARVKIPLIELHGKGKRILLIEDNNIVREFAVGGLREHGYTIFEAADAKKALEIFKREQGNFQLIFSDVVLPDINGIELVEQIQSSNPKIPALLCSGYTEQLSQLSKIR
ncbi:PAS domain S-box protein, partial [candidate division WOR-3 bacterium]|nr:PAS domain S-box protein [candidate division WOR-3 bacterium]